MSLKYPQAKHNYTHNYVSSKEFLVAKNTIFGSNI